jgi:hypothetical protein
MPANSLGHVHFKLKSVELDDVDRADRTWTSRDRPAPARPGGPGRLDGSDCRASGIGR